MKVILQTTLEHIRRNRRSSLAVMMAVLLSATMLCSFCIFGFAFWDAMVGRMRFSGGDWHGELFANTPGEMLPYIEGNPHVEAVMVKGAWQALKLPETSPLPYLFLRDANEAYWQGMSEKNYLMEGRIPTRAGEIAVSKLFFDRNPAYKIGDTLTVPVGERILDGEVLPLQSVKREGEGFRQTKEATVTLVGKLDITTTTAFPGYYALGFLEAQNIAPGDGLTIYLRFVKMRDTYKILPHIAQSVGLEPNEFGEYPLRYNSSLLSFYGISDGTGEISLSNLVSALMVGLTVALMILTFALIIGSVFSLSANARIRQLGMLRSVGAAPKQIKASILLEGLLLSVIPLLLAVLLGYLFSAAMGSVFTNSIGELMNYPLEIRFSPVVALWGAGLSLVTVLVAVNATARKMAKLTPIEAVRGVSSHRMKKRREKKHRIIRRLFGTPGMLAMENLSAYRRTFRMPVAALCVSFVLVGGTLSMISIATARSIMNAQEDIYYDADVTLSLSQERDDALIREICSLAGVKESEVSSSIGFGMPVTEDMQTEQFTALGGFAAVDKNRYNVVATENGFRIHGTLRGMDDASFARYCQSLGVSPEGYRDAETPRVVAVNALRPTSDARSQEEQVFTIPFLELAVGEVYALEEQTFEDTKSSYTFDVEIGAVTQTYPVSSGTGPNYRPVLVLPLAQYDAIVAEFLPERANLYRRVEIKLRTDLDGKTVEAALEKICSSYLGSEDYLIDSRDGLRERQAITLNSVLAMNNGIALLFALIGISNAFSAVAGNLAMRRREFAMLRAVGMDEKDFSRILLTEGLFFALRPILLAIPWIAAICAFFAFMMDLTFALFLSAFPFGQIFGYGLVVVAIMGLAYAYGARSIRRENIADALRSDVV